MSQTHQKQSSSKKGILVAVLCTGLALSPGRAMAGCPVMDIAGNLILVEMAGTLAAMLADIEYGFESVVSAINRTGSVITTAVQAQQNSDVKRTQAVADTTYAVSAINRAADLAAQDPENIAAYTHLCRTLRAQQATQYSTAAAGSWGARIAKDISQFPEKHEGTGKGPGYSRTMVAGMCGDGLPAGVGGFMDPDLDQPTNTNCTPQSGTAAERQERIGADRNMETIMPAVDKVPLEKPGPWANDNGTVMADAGDQAQLMFIAGRNYTYFAAGPSKRMPSGTALSSPNGLTDAATGGNCKSLRSGPESILTEQLQYVSRPDCSDSANSEVCAENHKLCADAVAHGVVLPASFGNCDQSNGEGISGFQAGWLNATRCFQSQEYVARLVAGGKTSDVIGSNDACLGNYYKWESNVLQRRTTIIGALNLLNSLRNCE